MNRLLVLLSFCLLPGLARSAVVLSIQDSNGVAAINYACTAGEVIRSFALDVRVERGRILGIADFFRGVSHAGAKGYGIFPAAFRDHITVSSGTNANWHVSGYTPLTVVADSPGDTLPGLNSSGVTLEFGGLWDPAVPASFPAAAGTLCTLRISEPAQVSVTANASRGGVLSAVPGVIINPVWVGAFVDPLPAITGVQLSGGVITISFKGGELETAPAVMGPWTGTGNSSGIYVSPVGEDPARLYRVNHH